jgi:uroporphyrin-III C-methyltransferase
MTLRPPVRGGAGRAKTACGKVFLVGAGPGDPELMTLKAVRILQQADVVLHDDLVNPQILAWAPAGARCIAVGKRGGCRSTPQAFIERLLIAEARRGHRVVRLKGGDPFVFGRGGEEMQALRTAGIDVEIVNGLTSGIAAPAALGIPLTHRGLAHGVAMITGHGQDPDQEPDWVSLTRSGLTLVIYMGLARAGTIRSGLRAAGMADDMPVAVIQDATLPGQKQLRATLADFPEAIARSGLRSPAVIVIGRVVELGAAALVSGMAEPRVAATAAG